MNEYVKSLLTPRSNGTKARARRVWSIDLEAVWLPVFTASNTAGDTAIPQEALGAPLRLAYGKDGSVRFNASGRPIIRVARDISEAVRLVRENLVANLMAYAGDVITTHETEYKAMVEDCQKAGKAIIEKDKIELSKAIEAKLEAEKAEAKAKAVKEAEAITKGKGKKETVTA
jgi:hypothetical protein